MPTCSQVTGYWFPSAWATASLPGDVVEPTAFLTYPFPLTVWSTCECLMPTFLADESLLSHLSFLHDDCVPLRVYSLQDRQVLLQAILGRDEQLSLILSPSNVHPSVATCTVSCVLQRTRDTTRIDSQSRSSLTDGLEPCTVSMLVYRHHRLCFRIPHAFHLRFAHAVVSGHG
ncbi:MAG: hypothetical protein IKU98_00745 [Bacteroidaceae bacterium]|nr:hypothetical protein [Bacteroidaceae bacterium]